MNDEQNIPATVDTSLNTSGLKPKEYNVLVRPDDVEEVTPGGVIRPPEYIDGQKRAISIGTLVAASRLAWNYDPKEEKIVPGTRVLFAKYAGGAIKGPADGVTYRIMKDKDILSEITDENGSASGEAPILHFPGVGVAA